MLYINKANRTDMRMLREVKKVNLCIQCKHYQNKLCNNFVSISLIDGEESKVRAVVARRKTDLCGPGGAYFRPSIETNPHNLNPPNLLPEDC